MTARIVVGLYESRGYAQDVRNRLKTEGVPEGQIALFVLREIAPVPESARPELAALSVDPLLIGDVQHTFARFIRNGETAVLVRADTEAEVELATDVMALYAPLAVEVLDRQTAGQI